VDLLVAYSNRSDLREQLQQVAVILLETASQDDEPGSSADSEVRSATRWWSLRDRFSPEDLQLMIDLYRSGMTAKQGAEKSVSASAALPGFCTDTAYAVRAVYIRVYPRNCRGGSPRRIWAARDTLTEAATLYARYDTHFTPPATTPTTKT
jgi:hypothetical protein